MNKSEKALNLLTKIHSNPEPVIMGLYLAAVFGGSLLIGSLTAAEIIKHTT